MKCKNKYIDASNILIQALINKEMPTISFPALHIQNMNLDKNKLKKMIKNKKETT